MNKILWLIGAIIVFLGVAFSGCGGGGGTGSPTPTPGATPTNTASVSPTTSPSPTPVPFINMIRVPGAAGFPTGTDDSGTCTTVNYAYYITQYEITYEKWTTVYNWALSHGYTFANAGSRGGYYNTSGSPGTFSSGHETDPVTSINWRDAIVWCNALTEYLNAQNGTSLGFVYKSSGTPIRDSTDTATCDAVNPDPSAKGYRLPLSMEWELAARYQDGTSWTPGNFASGSTANYTNAVANNAVAWYSANSNILAANIYSTQPVGWKVANALNIYDMSGNVWEWCFETYDTGRLLRGGSWYHPNTRLYLAYLYHSSSALNDAGLRPVRTE